MYTFYSLRFAKFCFINLLLPLYFAVLYFGCNNKASEIPLNKEARSEESIVEEKQEIQGALYTLATAIRTDFERAKKNNPGAFTSDTANFRKVDGYLSLQIDGEWKQLYSFKDTLNFTDSDDTDIREYKYLGQLQPVTKYVVAGYFWEFYECYLVDKETGKIDTTWNSPILSPDNKFIASLSLPYGLEGLPNGIQIFKAENEGEKITKFIEINQDEWSPYEAYWESVNSIIIKILPISRVLEINGIPKEEDFSYLRLSIN